MERGLGGLLTSLKVTYILPVAPHSRLLQLHHHFQPGMPIIHIQYTYFRVPTTIRTTPRKLFVTKLTPCPQLPPLTTPQRAIFRSNMSSGYSNTDTGSKTADPYTQKNFEEPSLKEKVEDLLAFVDKTKFCLLTTQVADSDLLASRAMAVAAKVGCPYLSVVVRSITTNVFLGRKRLRYPFPHQHRVWKNR